MKTWERKRQAKLLSEHRLADALGKLQPGVESLLRRMLTEFRNPLATADFDLWEDPETSARAYRANGKPISVNTEAQWLDGRLNDRMRRLIWPDVMGFRDRQFAAGQGVSAVSGVHLTIENTDVDHFPVRFKDIREDYLRQEGMVNPELAPSSLDDWPAFHRDAVGWSDGEASGLRLLTREEQPKRLSGPRRDA